MDIKDLRPKVFAVDPRSSDARKQWSHWFRSFGCYVQKYENISDEDKLSLLVNHVDALVYEIKIAKIATLEASVSTTKGTSWLLGLVALGQCY